jgi:tetratricopeptide (TPR) repeat protein
MMTKPQHDIDRRLSFFLSARPAAVFLLLLAWGQGGCTLTVDGRTVFRASDFFQFQPKEAGAGAPGAPRETTRLPDSELAIWNDPAFKRRFTESYLSETEIEPPMTQEETERLQEVYDWIAQDKMDKAADLLAGYRNEASSAVFDYLLANIHFQRDEVGPALEGYERAVEKFPRFRRAWRNLGLMYVRHNEHEKALGALTRVVELGGGDAITYGLLAFSYSAVEKHISAESAYRMAILMDPQTLDWKKGLASSFFRQRRFAEAVAICDQLLADHPGKADIWMLQANAFIGMNRPLDAAENYEMADRLGKSTLSSLSMLGDIYINGELYEMAVDSYLRALKKSPEIDPEEPEKASEARKRHTDRVIRAAKVLAARGAMNETEALVEGLQASRGKELDDGARKELYKLRARIAVAKGAEDEQARVLEEIVKLDPLDGEALLLLGKHWAGKQNLEQAIFYFERAAKIETFEADANIQHAQLLIKEEKYAEAIPLLRSAQKTEYRENVQKYLEQVERIAQNR